MTERDANYDYGSAERAEAYREETKARLKRIREEEAKEKSSKPNSDMQPKIDEFVERLKKLSKTKTDKPEHPNLLH